MARTENKYSLRWVPEGMNRWSGFMDGAKFADVYYTFSNGWAWGTDFTEDGEYVIEDGFFSPEMAMVAAEIAHQEWEEMLETNIASLELEITDEFLLSLLTEDDLLEWLNED